jgi:hypothetical protein
MLTSVREFMAKHKSDLICPICQRKGTITRSGTEKKGVSKERYQCRTADKCCISWKLERFYHQVMSPTMAKLERIADGLESSEEEQELTPQDMGESCLCHQDQAG